MAQTEMMLRLLKDGKIVGYKWILPFGEARAIYPEYQILAYPSRDTLMTLISEDGVNWRRKGSLGFADSFELGTKVGDEFWFEGDRVKDLDGDTTGVIVYEKHAYYVLWDTLNHTELLWDVEDNIKRTGNIREEVGKK